MVTIEENALILLLAAGLDYVVGDPWGVPHPVQAMGWVISRSTDWAIAYCAHKGQRRLAGIALGAGLIVSSALVGWGLVRVANAIHPLLGISVEVIGLASCFAGRSLRKAALDVLQPLRADDLDLARSQLSLYVGRDTENLTQSEILRAVLETVAENTPDGVTAPLFYAAIGALIPGVGSVPLALGYKAASTLDSMIGYRKEPWTDLGWFSARLEDCLSWLPCRLTVLTVALIARKPQPVWSLCRRDALKDPSPNSGWSECAYAAVLDVQLGGTNVYQGVTKHKPLLGNPIDSITPQKIEQALQLTRLCFLTWLGIVLGYAVVIGLGR